MASSSGAGKAALGSLVVYFLGDTKGLDESEKKASKVTKAFEDKMKKFSKVVSASVAGAIGAFGLLIAKSIQTADSLGKMAKSVDIPVERLSALKFATEQTGAQFENLSAGLLVLGKKMNEASANQFTPAAASFQAIGIAVNDANGKIRSTSDILDDVADRFSSYKDSVDKTQLAVQLFGEANGPKLLPLLSRGKAGMKELEEQAKKLGVTVTEESAKAAREFGEEMNYLRARVEGAAMQIANYLLPTLKELNAELKTRNGTDWARGVVASVLGVTNSFGGLKKITDPTLNSIIETEKAFIANTEAIKGAEQALSGYSAAFGAFLENRNKIAAPGKPEVLTDMTEAIIASARDAARAGLDEILNAPTETAVAKIKALEDALKSGAISWREFGLAVKDVSKEQESNLNDMLSATSQTLSAMFKESKAAAVASALINTYQGITKALAAYPPPVSYAMAAAQAAMGFAQVRAIRSTSKGSSGGSAAVSSGGSSAAASAEGGATESNVQRSLFVQGLNPNDLFTGKQVANIAESLMEFQRNGGQVFLDRS